MITIEINNATEVAEKRKGKLLTRIGKRLIDIDKKVETEITKWIKYIFDKEGIKTDIQIT